MTANEQKDLRDYCALLLKEYGFHISPNDPVVPALYIIHKEMQMSNQCNKSIASELKEASSKINPTVFNFNSEDAAFKFQVGMAVKWILVGALILTFAVVAIWYWSMVNKVAEAKTIIEASGNVGELMKCVKKDKDDFYFIDFTSTKGDSIQPFKEFQKIDARTVRVYVGKKSKQFLFHR